MNIHNPSQNVRVKSSLLLAITAAVVNGTAVDTQGYTRAQVVFDSQPSGAGTTSTVQLQSAPDNGSGAPGAWANVGTPLAAATGGTVGVQLLDVKLDGNVILGQRWLRLVHTGVGASAGGVAAGHVLLYNPQAFPVPQDNTVAAQI